ncbi:DUF4314 domain-containing protein [Streptococcus suis]
MNWSYMLSCINRTLLMLSIPDLDICELEEVDLPEGVALEGSVIPKPSDYLSTKQKNGMPLGADAIYKEIWLWLKERHCEKLVNKRLISKLELNNLRNLYLKGTRVKLLKMEDKQAPPIGTKGTVIGVDDIGSIMVAWDNGSHLGLVYREDKCQMVITDTLKKQIEKVRTSGKSNMLDIKSVQFIANQMNLHELVILIEEDRDEYIHYLFHQN